MCCCYEGYSLSCLTVEYFHMLRVRDVLLMFYKKSDAALFRQPTRRYTSCRRTTIVHMFVPSALCSAGADQISQTGNDEPGVLPSLLFGALSGGIGYANLASKVCGADSKQVLLPSILSTLYVG